MSTIWNLQNTLRTGSIKLLNSGRELYGTVIKHGKINKTITVKVDTQHWNNKYRQFCGSTSKFLVHDETNECISGDKVVIKVCPPVSVRKHYFVRNIVKPFPRNDFYDVTKEMDPALEQEYKTLYSAFKKQTYETKEIKDKKRELEIKKQLKAKALSKAIQNIRQIEINKKKLKATSDKAVNTSQEEVKSVESSEKKI